MKLRLPLVPFLVLIACTLSISAQAFGQAEKVLTEDEYDSAIDSTFEATSKRIRRVKKMVVSFTEGREIGSESASEEFIPPDSWHLLRILRAGSDATSFEIIEVGDAKYKRANQDIWSKWDRTKFTEMTIRYEGFFNDNGKATKYTARPSVLNGQEVVLYSKVSNPLGHNRIGIGIEEIWVSLAGLVMRVLATESEEQPIWTKRTEISYEYDPKDLKIEAPIK
jgi:hypothetical protein